MSVPLEGRLLWDAPRSGVWNMAVDEALLLGLETDLQPVLRIYAWDQPTLSLGYFQSVADRARHPASARCPLVRRMSGGGALVHDQELTYALILPRTHSLARDVAGLYRAVHECWVAALATHGPLVEFYAAPVGGPSTHEPKSQPFLCFQRREEFDLVFNGAKVVGSAQRRTKFGVVQHGSVLWSRSFAAPELWGVQELAGVKISPEVAAQEWSNLLGQRLGISWSSAELPHCVLEKATELAESKYGSGTWNDRR